MAEPDPSAEKRKPKFRFPTTLGRREKRKCSTFSLPRGKKEKWEGPPPISEKNRHHQKGGERKGNRESVFTGGGGRKE